MILRRVSLPDQVAEHYDRLYFNMVVDTVQQSPGCYVLVFQPEGLQPALRHPAPQKDSLKIYHRWEFDPATNRWNGPV